MLTAIKSDSRTDQVITVLTELITSGQLSSGDFLPSEADLGRQLGVSRATVRMALRTLETRGMVLARQGIGVQVTDRTRQAVTDSIELMLLRGGAGPRDMLEVRLMLECQGAGLAAQRATSDDLAAMAAEIGAMRDGRMEDGETVETDLRFHLRVVEASKNAVLVALVHALRGLLRDTIAATWRVNDRADERLHDHTKVLEAIAARNPPAAEKAMRTHLCRTKRLIAVMHEGGAIPKASP